MTHRPHRQTPHTGSSATPPPHEPSATTAPTTSNRPPRDELHHAKVMLLTVDDRTPSSGEAVEAAIRNYPYAAAALALAAGVMMGKGALSKKLVTLGGAWAMKKVLARFSGGK